MNKECDKCGKCGRFKASRCWVITLDGAVQGVYNEQLRAEGVYEYYAQQGGFESLDIQESEVG